VLPACAPLCLPFAHTAANGNDGGADGGDDDAAPVEEATQVQVDGSAWKVLFNEKAKLFARVNNDWQHRGVGMCSVRQPTGGPSAHKSYLMFTTLVRRQAGEGGLAGACRVVCTSPPHLTWHPPHPTTTTTHAHRMASSWRRTSSRLAPR
jgi:hypothetical protein